MDAVPARENTFDWSGFFALYQPMAVRFARGLVGHDDHAEDLVQEAFRALFQRVSTGELELGSREHGRNYLFRSVHNLAVSALRRPRREGEVSELELAGPEDDDPARLAMGSETGGAHAGRRRRVEQALAGLSEGEQRVLRQRFGQGLSFREISERDGEAISTLHSRVAAALKKIRGQIGKDTPRA
jgi:RNA polymerase sigma factor (sigma-70 family)